MLDLLPLGILAVGAYYTVALRGFYIVHPRETIGVLLREYKKEGKGALARLSLALAGTLGVGNIVGVAAGLLIGGAGSVFWLLLSSLLSAPVKYAESAAVLSHKQKSGRSFGFPSLIEGSFSRGIGRWLGAVYAILSLMLAFFMGSALQGAAVLESVGALLSGKGLYFVGISFVVLLCICILGDAKKISKATSILIPFAMIMYTILCIMAVLVNISRLPAVVSSIVRSAFTLKGIAGGVGGSALLLSMREGFLRGLLSNEAGAGTSAYAHAKNAALSPAAEGVLGMGEILFDTVVLCMLTAFAVLLSVEDITAYEGASALLCAAFTSALGRWALIPLSLSIFLFALSTAVCWYEYGRSALAYLGIKGGASYFLLYILFAAALSFLGSMRLIPLCDTVLFFLALIALPTLVKSKAAVCSATALALRGRENSVRPQTAADIRKDQSLRR